MKKEMSVNEVIKMFKQTFGDNVQYKATSKDGQVFKTKGFDDVKKNIDRRYK